MVDVLGAMQTYLAMVQEQKSKTEVVKQALQELRDRAWWTMKPEAERIGLEMGPRRRIHIAKNFDVRDLEHCTNCVPLRGIGMCATARIAMRSPLEDSSLAVTLQREGHVLCRELITSLPSLKPLMHTPDQTITCIAVLWDGADTCSLVAVLMSRGQIMLPDSDIGKENYEYGEPAPLSPFLLGAEKKAGKCDGRKRKKARKE